jgi:catechol 2,3-dioxygenase-like lactoylglutathione lyase family enzyme
VIEVKGFDHVVLRCVDVETTLAWYRDRLGLAPVRVDEWRAGDAPFPSVRVDEGTIIDLIPAYASEIVGGTLADGRIDHICLVVGEDCIEQVLGDGGFTVVDGPGPRFGARGVATSVYVKDPDGLVVELRCYPA